MRTIVHLSDLHFGRTDPELVEPLISAIRRLNPTLLAVSGDLTQRARSHQFREARAFLDALPQPKIVVPGNHDIPLYNLYNRFFQPLDKYRRHITDDLQPTYSDDEMIVVGVSTARSLELVSMLVIGGEGTLVGPLFGSVLLTMLPTIFQPLALYKTLVSGGLLVLCFLYLPEGIFGVIARYLARLSPPGGVPAVAEALPRSEA